MSIAACAETVRQMDPDRFLSVMAASPALRADLFVLYAFNIEVARAPWASNEEMIAEMRLQFWRDVVDAIDEGREAHRHELVAPLRQVIRDHRLPVKILQQIIEARRWDIYRDAFADESAFARYIDHTSGNLMWQAARVVGTQDNFEADVREYAYCVGVSNWLVAVPELVARGRTPLLDGSDAGVLALSQDALTRMAKVKKRLPKQAAPALRAGWLAGGVLKAAIGNPERVKTGRLQRSEFQRRSGLLLRSMTGRW